jgi:maltose-binding protein MalE
MIRRSFLIVAALVAAAWLVPASATAQGKASTLDTAKAKGFIGEWVLTIEGRRGPQERPLSITDVGGKVAAELSGGRGGPVSITDITMSGSDLVLKWSQQGPNGEVPIVMTLTMKDGGLVVKQDIAGGQFSASGTGKKKG